MYRGRDLPNSSFDTLPSHSPLYLGPYFFSTLSEFLNFIFVHFRNSNHLSGRRRKGKVNDISVACRYHVLLFRTTNLGLIYPWNTVIKCREESYADRSERGSTLSDVRQHELTFSLTPVDLRCAVKQECCANNRTLYFRLSLNRLFDICCLQWLTTLYLLINASLGQRCMDILPPATSPCTRIHWSHLKMLRSETCNQWQRTFRKVQSLD